MFNLTGPSVECVRAHTHTHSPLTSRLSRKTWNKTKNPAAPHQTQRINEGWLCFIVKHFVAVYERCCINTINIATTTTTNNNVFIIIFSPDTDRKHFFRSVFDISLCNHVPMVSVIMYNRHNNRWCMDDIVLGYRWENEDGDHPLVIWLHITSCKRFHWFSTEWIIIQFASMFLLNIIEG